MIQRAISVVLVFILLGSVGCVRRTISITTEPPGALVWLNDREIGRTPLEVDFLFYGIYDVRLVKEDFEPLITTGNAKVPIWDTVGLDLVSELMPFELHSRVEWHYVLESVLKDEADLLRRARELRSRVSKSESPSLSDEISPEGH